MKKLYYAFILIMLLILTACNKAPEPADTMTQYINLWNKQKFASMYELLSTQAQKSISKEDFVNRYEKYYKDLEIAELKATFKKPENEEKPKEDKVTYPFSASMNSIAGEIAFDHQATLIKEEKNNEERWTIDWNTTYIFPDLEEGAKISLSTVTAKRGEIIDRTGQGLAVNGQVYEVGIVPAEMGEQKEEIITQLSTQLGITTEKINNALNASWVKPEYFVPIKKLPLEERELAASLTTIPSVNTKQVAARVYPMKEAAAHLIGYVGPITAEELEKREGKGYTANDSIGKRGLEQVLDERLKGENGVTIKINKADGTETVLAEKEVKDGENVQLTIDAALQTKLFGQLADQAGTAAALHPKTGETLGLVSSPSFDPNLLSLGATAEQWTALQDNPLKPLLNRFSATYAPGSVIKPLTAAIGLKEGTLDPAAAIQVTGLQWQKDSSWGNYYVTRVTDPGTSVDLEKSLLYSDNIYYAQAALALGKDKLADGLKGFGFEEEIEYLFPLQPSKTGPMDRDILLADSGYGQAQVEMNILHLAATYTPFINSGKLIKPTLLIQNELGKAWKQNVISEEQAAHIHAILQKVVNDPRGTAHRAYIPGMPLAGKTGTAELKAKQGEKGTENGWFVAYNTENPSLLIAMMVEGVQETGSSVVVEKVRNIFAQ
ncbi:penicillin-binding transpeptidase domain-containing protein [Niallia endozanthoxylica]|uniref:serine-type D-Ala-D-Ala carboxypeptidase n=1 Tax=Niallia endozanthoxylica TaxID=2036016 RepID=A0A5J5H2A8_9BACI|nr:penicillin-binding transpeptidase domain-containing protein [Niallia endozanthoxylica]KAA9013832.1 penicillin-binding transpeptidase domain-containing protein [Niallia endozanthoxylica]